MDVSELQACPRSHFGLRRKLFLKDCTLIVKHFLLNKIPLCFCTENKKKKTKYCERQELYYMELYCE